MSLREDELSRSQRAKRIHAKQHARKKKRPAVSPPPDDFDLPHLPDDDEVLPFPQWCLLNSLSIRTARKLRAAGTGPVITQLSEKRIGVTRRNNRVWQASRARS